MRRPLAALGLAITFLTIVPVRLREPVPPLGTAAGWFPAVGAAVGALAGVVSYLAEPPLGPLVAAVLAVVMLVVITGALHQDGLADCADGLGVRGDRARRLAVMREPTVGTFGVLAVALWLLLVVAAVSGLNRTHMVRALVVMAATGRWAALLHATATLPARRDGLGSGFEVGVLGLAAGTVLAVTAAVVLGGIGPGLGALAASAAVAVLVTAWSRGRLGGRTGDTLGATVALAEAAVAIVLLGVW
ncbi:adenosylcobinamide-GDP ribazoletransferase [Baekduia soli]|uniref:Adenosylcobinamide-GDP ribazoletransferase n=1 Tax=Baekduia soli TaxID=496014 RepID=A0A5B8U243_9ACTN|nr:adenosylcobinamide-GDP ribazoletransferase [Baekduia soli]QEC47021.1 adenosylcobinamide-GDP ribazoletransferase [Baekduia soli]